jgi:ribosomal protein S12 methylthiotransferase accessory factor
VSAVAGLGPLDAAKRYFLGTHRTCAPQETLARLDPLLRGMGITRVANVTGLDRTGIPVVMVCRPNSRSLTVSQGKGMTLEGAKASGVMEAVEAWHAERVMRPLVLASFQEMRDEHRVADVACLPRSAESRFSPALPLLWVEGEDLHGGESVWVPYELVSANYTLPQPPGSGCFQANTNGLACGNHWLEAASHALCEVVERDATTLWKHRSPRAQAQRMVDVESVDHPACRNVLGQLAAAGLHVRIWDTTSDVGIACFVCLLIGPEDDNADPEFGAGCHPARHIALLRALTEAAQARTTFIAGARDDYLSHLYSVDARARRRALCERLLESPAQPRAFADAPDFESSTVDDDLRWMLARLRAAGIDQVVGVDLGRPAIGVPVVRVIVPGLEGVMDEEHGDYAPGRRARRCLQEAT